MQSCDYMFFEVELRKLDRESCFLISSLLSLVADWSHAGDASRLVNFQASQLVNFNPIG